jgi:hypothetical protein
MKEDVASFQLTLTNPVVDGCHHLFWKQPYQKCYARTKYPWHYQQFFIQCSANGHFACFFSRDSHLHPNPSQLFLCIFLYGRFCKYGAGTKTTDRNIVFL